jgi:hypothetical protein
MDNAWTRSPAQRSKCKIQAKNMILFSVLSRKRRREGKEFKSLKFNIVSKERLQSFDHVKRMTRTRTHTQKFIKIQI